MTRPSAFRPSVTALESRRLPTAGLYPDAARNALQALYVAQAAAKANDLVFLGDSITQYWGTAASPSAGTAAWSANFAGSGAANFGIGGDTTRLLVDRIAGGDLAGQPKVVVLMIGVNDLMQGATAGQAASGIASVVGAIHATSPGSRVLLLGLLPTEDPALNAQIPGVNARISALASEPYVTYLNPGAQFAQADGSAQPGLLRDAVHPDAAGYQVLAGAIGGTVAALLREAPPAPNPAPHPPPLAASTSPSPGFAIIPILQSPDAGAVIPSGLLTFM